MIIQRCCLAAFARLGVKFPLTSERFALLSVVPQQRSDVYYGNFKIFH